NAIYRIVLTVTKHHCFQRQMRTKAFCARNPGWARTVSRFRRLYAGGQMSVPHDFRYALRLAARNWPFSAAVVLILALTIGEITAVLSIINFALLRRLPFPEPDRLAQLILRWHDVAYVGIQQSHNGRTWDQVRDHASSVLNLAVSSGKSSGVNLTS